MSREIKFRALGKKAKKTKREAELEEFLQTNPDMAEELLYRYSGIYRAYEAYKGITKNEKKK